MSLLLSSHEIQKSFGSKNLFDGLSLGINAGDRIGIIGNNGVGKSTLLKILAGEMETDGGEISRRRFLKVSYIAQDSKFSADSSIHEIMMAHGHRLDIPEADLLVRVPMLLSKAGFQNHEVLTKDLSGGWKKRLAIVMALIQEPDLVFLDEPTNHLDFESVLWLEDLLKSASFAWLMISHDRYFLDRTVKKIAEINKVFPGGIFVQECNYSQFDKHKQEYLDGLARQEEALSNKVRREVEWLRRGPKARTTKAKYRIDDANRMIADLANLRQKMKTSEANIGFDSSGRKTKQLLLAQGISKSFDDKLIFKDLSLVLSPGITLGVLGVNGCGKSTLLKVLQKQLAADEGDIAFAPDLKIVYFDQNRQLLDPEETLKSALSEHGSESVIFQDRSIHIVTWAKRFQFTNEQLTQKVGTLSGGEQARVLISRLMQQKADILILDEPTNDLDIQTLEILEESLQDFPGSIVLVSHDRYLMTGLADLCLGFLGDGKTQLYADYEQWERECFKGTKASSKAKDKKLKKPKEKVKKVKLSYMEQREFDQIEEKILEAEGRLEECSSEVEKPELASDAAAMQAAYQKLQEAQENIDKLYARWTELEEKQQGGS